MLASSWLYSLAIALWGIPTKRCAGWPTIYADFVLKGVLRINWINEIIQLTWNVFSHSKLIYLFRKINSWSSIDSPIKIWDSLPKWRVDMLWILCLLFYKSKSICESYLFSNTHSQSECRRSCKSCINFMQCSLWALLIWQKTTHF